MKGDDMDGHKGKKRNVPYFLAHKTHRDFFVTKF